MKNDDKKNKSIHSGHRERLRQNLASNGIYNADDIHFLEYLLTFVITRADTNPIAHSLLETFGSIDEIFNAGLEALLDVAGVGIKTARFLQYMSVVCHKYNKTKALQKAKLNSLSNIVSFIQNVLPPSENEQLILIIVSKNYALKSFKVFNGVSHSFISLDVNEVTDFLVKHKSKFLILAHTHPKHKPEPSLQDIEMFKSIKTILNALSITLIENLILGENSVYSERHNATYGISNPNITTTKNTFIGE